VARKITVYFFIFGLIVFLITSLLYMGGTRKHFIGSTSQLIKHQFSLMDASQEPDFIWKAVGKPNPELHQLFELLTNLSSSFYTVSDISIYALPDKETLWYRVFFYENVLHLNPAQETFTKKLDRNLKRHFERPGVLARSSDEHALFVNITAENDLNTYFLKIGIDSESIAGIVKKEAKWIVVIFLIALGLSRFLGYYFARKIARPIENLSEISADVAKGDLTHLAPVTSRDEIGSLANNFNQMVQGLREWERVKMVEFELEKGRQIQREFLPSQIPRLPNWEIATCFYPAGKVSGDFYDVFMLPDGNVGLVIADVRVFAEQSIYCTGPGLAQIASAPDSVEAVSSSQNDQMVRLGAVSSTNNYIAHIHGRECMYATLFFGVLNPSTGNLSYVNGGHEPLCVINAGGIKELLMPTGPAVGLMPDITFKAQQIQLAPGDLLVGYTDGVIDARSPKDEIYTRDRLQSLLAQPFKSASDTLERIKTNLFSFIDFAPRSDDVTMLAVQRVPI
jgi:serine phosphatase RsbU (regulator of sigma subunit)